MQTGAQTATALPAIIEVHFADLSAPLIVSSLEIQPPLFAEVPVLLSRYFSEQSRWAALRSSALAATSDPNCSRGIQTFETATLPVQDIPLPIVLKLRGLNPLRVRLDRSLSSKHVGTLRPGHAFAFSEVGDGWAKLSPMHLDDLQHSQDRCDVSAFKHHNLETHGYCITSIEGREIFEPPSDQQKYSTLELFKSYCSKANPASAATCSSAKQHSPPGDILQKWQGPRQGVDISRFSAEGLVRFRSDFSTLRGPPFYRHQRFCGYEIQIVSVGPVPQFGFCTANFPRNESDNGEGCGDDGNSWAWDGLRHMFWINGEVGRRDLPRLSWARGDVLSFECDFLLNETSISVNGDKKHTYAFGSDVDVLYPALTSRDDEIKVNFGPFQFLQIPKPPPNHAGAQSQSELPATVWEWPSNQPPSCTYSDSGECVNMTVYVKLALPLHSNLALQWRRFLRCALYFSYASSAPMHRSKRAMLLQVRDMPARFCALDRVGDWSAALAAKKANDSKMPSDSSGFDEDVLQLLGADFIPPKEVADMTADDVAERIASAPALNYYLAVLKGSVISGSVLMQCSEEELSELLLDAETAIIGQKVDSNNRRLILDYLLALKSNEECSTTAVCDPALQFDGISHVHTRSSAETVFRALQSCFPQDARVFDLDLAALCDWPDFAGCSWQNGEIAVPLLGVSVGGVSLVHTEEFSLFFPSDCSGSFNVAKAWVLPSYHNTPSHNSLLSSLSSAINIPSVTSAARDHCALVVVLSDLTESCLDVGVALELLPALCPSLPLSLLRKTLDIYQQLLSPIKHSRGSLKSQSVPEMSPAAAPSMDDAAKSLLFSALKSFLEPSWSVSRLPILKRIAKLLLACAHSAPMHIYRSGLLDAMFKMPVNAHNRMMIDAVIAVTPQVCVLPANPSNPCDILHSGSPNNWPDLLANFVPDIHNAGHRTFDSLARSFLCGRSYFLRSCGALHEGVAGALHAVLAVHFRAHGASSKVYQESVMICCASGFKSHHLPSSGAVDAEDKFEKGDYSCETLVSLARILMRLVVHGNFKHSHIVPCAAFLRSCIRLQDATIELESLYGTIDTILSAIIPALDPHNDSPLHVCMLPRAAYDLMSQFRGLELLRIEADGMQIENVVASLGWCEVSSGEERACTRLPLMHGGLIDELQRRRGSSTTVSDLTAATNIPYQIVHNCMQELSVLKLVDCVDHSPSSSTAVFRICRELPTTASSNAADVIPPTLAHLGPSPLSVQHVEAYIEICNIILNRIILSYQATPVPPFSEAQLIADVSLSESIPAAHVASVLYYLVARNIVKLVHTGTNSFVLLHHDEREGCLNLGFSAERAGVTIDRPVPALRFDSSGILHKIVVFTILYDDTSPATRETNSVLKNCLLSLNTTSCVQFEQKSSAEELITRTINQLCKCSNMSFLMAAKELMNAHGYPERVLIKCVDAALYSKMFSDDVVFAPQAAGAAVFNDNICNVCRSEDHLIQLPCKHCICDDCFNARFLSDSSQHVYGALPMDQTPSASVQDDSPRPATNSDFFSCPLCNVPLGSNFWSEFPDIVKHSQREMPESAQVTLEHVHRKIVLNTLRVLRQDPLAAFARCNQDREDVKSSDMPTSGCYVASLNVVQPVTCLGRSFDSICDIKNMDKSQRSLDDQWQSLTAKIGLSSHAASGSENESDLKPQFVPDSERPQNEAGRLMDFRMCPVCFFGNIVNTTCNRCWDVMCCSCRVHMIDILDAIGQCD